MLGLLRWIAVLLNVLFYRLLTMADTQNVGYTPQESLYSANSDYNAISFVIKQMINKIGTNTVVQIVSVTNAGGVAAVGFCDVLPLVGQTDGSGNVTPHGVVHNLPYVRLQGGTNAIIMDPQVGDIGVAFFCMSDISAVKKSKAASPPGSGRRNSFADGIYLGGILNGIPVQYIRFISTGIEVISPTQITLTAPIVTINAMTSINLETPIINTDGNFASTSGGASTFTGDLHVTGDVLASGTSLHTHVHGGVQTGGGDTGVPI